MTDNHHFHLSLSIRTTSIYLCKLHLSFWHLHSHLNLLFYKLTLFKVAVSMVKVILKSYLYIQYITIKTKYAVIQFSSVLIFRSKKCVRTQTSNYVKLELLINQSSIAILKWDLALETTTRVTTREKTIQHEYNTCTTRKNTSTTRHNMRQHEYNTSKTREHTRQHECSTTQHEYNTT